jgi:ABC-type bacteriocin/lantibiotic exporter with double-glycine peptidase domain
MATAEWTAPAHDSSHGGNGSHAHDDHLFHNMHPWRRLRALLKTESSDLWIALIYSAAIGLVSLVLPVTVQAIVNSVAFGTVLQPLFFLTLFVFVALIFNVVLNGYRSWVVEVIQRKIFVRMANDTTLRLVRLRSETLEEDHAPELVNRFLDVVTVQKAAASLLVDGLSVFMQTLIGMILLGVYHPWLLAFDVLLLVFIGMVLIPLGFGAVATAVKESKAKYALVAWLEEIARHQIAFKSRAGAALAISTTSNIINDYISYRSKHFRILLRQIVGSFLLQAIASSVLLGVGGWLVINRQLTLGQLVAAEIVVALVVSGFTKFGKHLETFYDLMAAMDKLGYLTDLELEKEGGEPLLRASHGAQVRLEKVTVTLPARGTVIDNVSMDIASGARIGIAGHTGRGKSTLLDVIFGIRSPRSGFVEIDGRDLRDLQLGEVREQVALVREPEIFHGTIMENLRLGRETLDSLDAREVLEQVGLFKQVMHLPDGLNTQLRTGGLPLSPGQRVQLEIARALVHKPRLLIIDEALDALDDLPERGKLLELIFRRDAPWTLVTVSDSAEVLSLCDRVYELNDDGLNPCTPAAARRS